MRSWAVRRLVWHLPAYLQREELLSAPPALEDIAARDFPEGEYEVLAEDREEAWEIYVAAIDRARSGG